MVSLASVSDSLKVWKFDDLELTLTSEFQAGQASSCIAWNHTNQVVAVGGSDSKIYLVHASNGQVLSSLQVSEELGGNSSSISFSDNSRFLAAAVRGDLQLWDLKARQIKSVMVEHRGDITATRFLPTGEIIAGDKTGAVRIWDSKAFISSPELKLPSVSGSIGVGVTSLEVSHASAAYLATGYTDGSLGIWDAATYRLLRKQHCHAGLLNAVSYSPKNPRLVATGGSDGKVTLIDTGSKSSAGPSAVIEMLGRVPVTSVSFHEDAVHTALGLQNGNVLVYDWRSIKHPVVEVAAHGPSSVMGLSFQVR
jgi:WD40 repeat protein